MSEHLEDREYISKLQKAIDQTFPDKIEIHFEPVSKQVLIVINRKIIRSLASDAINRNVHPIEQVIKDLRRQMHPEKEWYYHINEDIKDKYPDSKITVNYDPVTYSLKINKEIACITREQFEDGEITKEDIMKYIEHYINSSSNCAPFNDPDS